MRLLTAPGEGGIAVIEVGAEEAAALDALSGGRASALAPGGIAYGWLREGARAIDEALIWRGGRGFEVGLHGGGAAAAAAMRALRRAGARDDGTEEKRGSVEAEAAALLPGAATLASAVFLAQAADGAFTRELASGDRVRLRALLERASAGRALAFPRTVVLAGPPNAGKSTLLNALCGRERAVVHEEAGTTRDPVEGIADFEGYPVRVVDTAGLGAGSLWEEEARRRMAEGDAVVWLVDPRAPSAVPQSTFGVSGKCDLGIAVKGLPRVSGTTGEGLAELRRLCLDALRLARPADPRPAPFTAEQEAMVRAALHRKDR